MIFTQQLTISFLLEAEAQLVSSPVFLSYFMFTDTTPQLVIWALRRKLAKKSRGDHHLYEHNWTLTYKTVFVIVEQIKDIFTWN